MAEKKWETLQKDVTLALNPLITRRDYYRDGLIAFRQLLTGYFFDETLISSLTETAKAGERVFDFNQLKEGLALCLTHEDDLTGRAFTLQQSMVNQKLSLASALDAQVLGCGLPLSRDKEDYYFNYVPAFTPKAQAFMRQFAYGLSLYRVYLGIFDVYFDLLNYPFLAVDDARSRLEHATAFRNSLPEDAEESSLLLFWKQAKWAKKNLKSLLNPLHDEAKNFETTFLIESPRLALLFDDGAKKLEECYRAFPNTHISFVLYDSPWQVLLKNMAVNLFQRQYTYSTIHGTLSIFPSFTEKILGDVMQFHAVALAKQLDYKSELLIEAIRTCDETLANIRKQAARIGLVLVEAPVSSVFSSFGPSRTWPDDKKRSPASSSSISMRYD